MRDVRMVVRRMPEWMRRKVDALGGGGMGVKETDNVTPAFRHNTMIISLHADVCV